MKNIEKILPLAIKAINKFIVIGNNTVPKEFKGYIASFGASIIQSGVKPSLAFYSQAKDSKGDRSFLIPALVFVLIEEGILNPDNKKILTEMNKIEENPKHLKKEMYSLIEELFLFIDKDTSFAKKKILEAAIGLKLALRFYKTSEKDNG